MVIADSAGTQMAEKQGVSETHPAAGASADEAPRSPLSMLQYGSLGLALKHYTTALGAVNGTPAAKVRGGIIVVVDIVNIIIRSSDCTSPCLG